MTDMVLLIRINGRIIFYWCGLGMACRASLGGLLLQVVFDQKNLTIRFQGIVLIIHDIFLADL